MLLCGRVGGEAGGVVVETEAYTGDDPASHSSCGLTERNRPMFMAGGVAYVYLAYGMHSCFNVSAGEEGSGEGVLVRAIRPEVGLDIMRARSGRCPERDLCRGPGRLCRALGIDRRWSGRPLASPGPRLLLPDSPPDRVSRTVRIGISRGRDMKRRWVLSGSDWLSGPATLRPR